MVVAGTGAALGGGNVAGAMAGSAAGDAASGALSGFTGQVTADLPAWLRPIATNIVTSTVSGVAGGIAGSAVGGSGGTLSGAGAAMSADEFNRQLHPVELDRIRQLANGDPKREAALTAAACALVKCYAEYAEGSQEYIFWKSIADIGASSGYADLRNQLSSQTAFFQGGSTPGHSPSAEQALFGYSASDAAIDALSAFDSGHGRVLTKGMATLQVAGGYTASVTGRALTISGITSCAASFGSGCMVAAGGIVLSGWAADQVAAGLMTISGHPTGTFGAQALVSVFGMSPGAAELLYGMAGGAAASAAGSARQIPGTVIVKDGEMNVVGQPGVQVKGYGGQTENIIASYNPLNKGPLPDEIAATFRSGTYREVVNNKPITLYRIIGDNGNPAGPYWTKVEPKGPLQSVIDSALDQNWGNTATKVVEMQVPAGTHFFEGVAAHQRGLVGGGNQIYFDKTLTPFDPRWIK
ncbi:hypothetical protein [Granulibacter bethesdensis]|uniref:hypothetical protein n=1 Tax=Granulibacter bethesdensis TaxID=364410 RepID=UPI0012FE2B5A|nr:hypothetical protein [Granulibacter bethesdensis]